jgi:flagellar motor protein MotB
MTARHRGSVLTNILAILMLLEIAALAGLGGYIVLTGAVTEDQLRLVTRVLEGKITDDTVAGAESWLMHEQEMKRKEEEKLSGADAMTKLAATSIEAEASRLGLLQQFKEVKDQRNLVNQKIGQLERQRKMLAEQEARIDKKITDLAEGGGQKSFTDMIGVLKLIKPDQIKEVLLTWDDRKVVRVLRALPARTAKKVLEQFTGPVEVDLKQRWLQMIASGDIVLDDTSGK